MSQCDGHLRLTDCDAAGVGLQLFREGSQRDGSSFELNPIKKAPTRVPFLWSNSGASHTPARCSKHAMVPMPHRRQSCRRL